MAVDHPQFGTFCAICFAELTIDKCAVDKTGTRWDVCRGNCAKEAGIIEAKPTRPGGPSRL